MKIILFILGFILISIWLAFIISVGVGTGIKRFYEINFQSKKEEKKNESI